MELSKNPCARDLSRAAGKKLQEECTAWVQSNGAVPSYSFAETSGGKLKCQLVLHAVCGHYDGQNSEKVIGYSNFSIVVRYVVRSNIKS